MQCKELNRITSIADYDGQSRDVDILNDTTAECSFQITTWGLIAVIYL